MRTRTMRDDLAHQGPLSSSFEKAEGACMRPCNAMPPSKSASEHEANTLSRNGPPATSAVVLRSAARGSSASLIRSRFLHSLGILQCPPHQRSRSPETASSRKIQRKCSDSFHEALKGDRGMPEDEESVSTISWQSISSVGSSGHRSRSVSFDEYVTVVPIPNRNAYSERIRAQLWTPPVEMQENAARNTFEFAAENWDWRQVTDEKDMVDYNGELIHPIHFMIHDYDVRNLLKSVSR